MKRVTLVIFLRVRDFFGWWYQKTISKASLNTKQKELHMQGQQQTHECERLKKEESERQALNLQMQQLQLECENLRKWQEEHESERLKEEESKRQEMQQIRFECENLRMKQDELRVQVQELTHECERLKEKESTREALTLQMQELQLECDNLRKKQEESGCERLKKSESERQALAFKMQQLQIESDILKKKEFEFKSLVAAAHSLKSKVDKFCHVFEKCDADVASQPDSSWELCTLMTEGSGISVDTAGRCFMREAVFKASEVLLRKWNWSPPTLSMKRTFCSTFEWIRVWNQCS